MLWERLIGFACVLCLGIVPSSVVAQKTPTLGKRPPLGLCEGECKTDGDCEKGLSCHKLKANDTFPARCVGSGERPRLYCYFTPGTRKQKVEKIKHIGTSQAYVKGYKVFKAKIKVPQGTQAGDLLLLVLHRTDDYLPFNINRNDNSGWIRAGECYKDGNGRDCSTFKDCELCTNKDDLEDTRNVFCREFLPDGQMGPKTAGDGRDLAQVIYYKKAGKAELEGSRTIKLNLSPRKSRREPAWMFLSAIRGADTTDPIRDWNATGNDNSPYSVFPSVYGKQGDLLLLSQSLDSGAPGIHEKTYLPPKGFQNFASMFDCDNPKSRESKKYECDESGYLFGRVLGNTGYTGQKRTRGTGGPPKSDGLVAMTIMPKGGSKDKNGRGASEWLGTGGEFCPDKKSRPKL